MIILGVDPGKSGAAVVMSDHGIVLDSIRFSCATWPEVAVAIDGWTSGARSFAVLEKVASSPQMGVRSAFTFGNAFGMIHGILTATGVPVELVTPQKWQRAMSMSTRKGATQPEHKRRLRGVAQERWPGRNIVQEDADAYLIAEYARQLWASRGG